MDNRSQSEDTDIPDESSGSMDGLNTNSLFLRPVAPGESGEGLPYAPQDWPNPGDVWGWKVGKRITNSGFMTDRYLYLPSRLQKSFNGKNSFASKLAVQEYIRKEFPSADMNAFFASFSWRIPSKHRPLAKEVTPISSVYPGEEMTEHSGSEFKFWPLGCKVGNKMCNLQLQGRNYSLPTMDCDICCSETGFCRDCCCILCCKTIDWAYGGYSFVRCEERVNESYICGHVAHMECALRSYMAGTIGGSIGLDVEYYCRRCDKRTDLILHVTRLIKTCESLNTKDDIEKILNLGLGILGGSQQESAKRLRSHVELALTKLKGGRYFQEGRNMEDISPVSAEDISHPGNNGTLSRTGEIINTLDPMDVTTYNDVNNKYRRSQRPVYITSDHQIESVKLEEEISAVLQDLRNSQEYEYRIAEESLYMQKNILLDLYQQLDTERSELARRTLLNPDCDVDELLTNVMNRVNQIKREVAKLKDMEEVAKGFGRVPKDILKEHFGLQIED